MTNTEHTPRVEEIPLECEGCGEVHSNPTLEKSLGRCPFGGRLHVVVSAFSEALLDGQTCGWESEKARESEDGAFDSAGHFLGWYWEGDREFRAKVDRLRPAQKLSLALRHALAHAERCDGV